MSISAYLPSAQFAVLVGALVLSGALVAGARYLTLAPPPTIAVTAPPSTDDWQTELALIQAQAGVSLPEAPTQETVQSLLAGAETENLTETLARSLFITLTDAKARGLGDDIPTQEQLVAQAVAQAEGSPATVYAGADLVVVAQSPESMRKYGNKMMEIFAAHPAANAAGVIVAVGYVIDYNDQARLQELAKAEAEYKALAQAFVDLAVPQTLAPLHLSVINSIAAMGTSVGDMRLVASDPVRGLAGVQRFYSLGGEAARVLTTIAGTFNKNGILFNKDEPGSAWAAFLQ